MDRTAATMTKEEKLVRTRRLLKKIRMERRSQAGISEYRPGGRLLRGQAETW
jgi:hypothetical protein